LEVEGAFASVHFQSLLEPKVGQVSVLSEEADAAESPAIVRLLGVNQN
jgi:hypothetical protein